MPTLTDNARDRAYLTLIINSALRAGSAAQITVGDVDLDGGWLTVKITKTYEVDRFPITADLSPELEGWLHEYALTIGRPLRQSDYLFPVRVPSRYAWVTLEDGTKERRHTPSSWEPTRHVTKTERIVQGALKKAGLPTRGEGTHTIRRGVARAYFDMRSQVVGYDGALRDVSAMLHHSSSATTEKYLGMQAERERRDKVLRGQPFLSAMTGTSASVLPLHRAGASSPHQ
ncbi:tyrosine-type recombinase/integrase [Ornithinimicrobium sediminis]|uniref:tyrosine-type recombinase/integrase n=1 Tax=Ornithinimicrobium sediminis TaxID=2904603 RepID=UPI001E37E6BA|nr:tyrosine-type recombinase/integrase [Ornithinimicrobium sediminis]MCE0486378.1 tyrosine-type recombinase/integrase [Ornithinimicrobium sediminis]